MAEPFRLGPLVPIEECGFLFCPLFSSPLPAGFPSPADDYVEAFLDLNAYLIDHPAATFFARAQGGSMEGIGIFDNDLLIIDRAVEASDNTVVVARIGEEFTVKRMKRVADGLLLVPENPLYPSLEIDPFEDFEVWGVVKFVIHPIK
jgi:DNA polymerase V